MRKIWMFPRNKRRMYPLDTALILRAMVVASELGSTWGGDQGQQNQFSKLLENYGLKSGGNQRDKNPGGSRTYEAQMRSLGLLYKDEGGSLKLTQSGEDMVSFNQTSKTFQYQILKFQYPSAYSMGRNVNIDLSIKIRPFLFLLKLASDPELDGLSDRDMMIPVVFGESSDSYDLCKSKIIELRLHGIESVVPDSGRIRTTKTQFNSYIQRIKDIKDIANTFKNVLQGAGLVDLRLVDGETRVFPATHIKERFSEIENLPFVDFSDRLEQSTLQYGRRLGAIKDTRRVFMPSKNPELFTKSSVILQRFLDTIDLPATQAEITVFVEKMQREFHIETPLIIEALSPVINSTKSYTGARLIELSKGGTKLAESFEKNVTKIFEVDFGYHAEWTGRRRSSSSTSGGYMDVFVVETGRNKCGIIDTKSMKQYDLPHQDVAKAKMTYIDTVSELFGNRGNLELEFVAYVSHLIGQGAETRAQEIFDAKNVSVSLISAYGLNRMREDVDLLGNPIAVTNMLAKSSVNLII